MPGSFDKGSKYVDQLLEDKDAEGQATMSLSLFGILYIALHNALSLHCAEYQKEDIRHCIRMALF